MMQARLHTLQAFVILVWVLLIPSIAFAVPSPHSVSGYVYADAAKTTQVAWATPYTVTDYDSGDSVSSTTGGGPFSGWYGTTIMGEDGDYVGVHAENSSHYGEAFVVLAGDMFNVDVIMDQAKGSSVNLSQPTQILPRNSSISEVEAGDKADFIVTVGNPGAGSYDANVSLSILNWEKYLAGWGPDERLGNKAVAPGGTTSFHFNNSEVGYTIPSSAYGTYYMDIVINYAGAYQYGNNNISFSVVALRDEEEITSTVSAPTMLTSQNITYNLTILNPFTQGNLTSISLVSHTNLTCTSDGVDQVDLPSLAASSSTSILFSCHAPLNFSAGTYPIFANITYTNPNNITHSKTYFARQEISVQRLYTSGIERHFLVTQWE